MNHLIIMLTMHVCMVIFLMHQVISMHTDKFMQFPIIVFHKISSMHGRLASHNQFHA